MTALKPLETADIRAVSDHDEERKLLRRAILNPVCAHPHCDDKNVEGHHIWPRSFISNSSWYVRIPEVDKPILHVTGLCRKHHSDVEEHRGWIRYEDGNFVWDEKRDDGQWGYIGDLDPQPGAKAAGKKKLNGKKKGEPRPYRAQWNVGVPKDERENGADVLDELEQAVREKYQEEMGWSSTAPRYHVIALCLVKALQ